MSTAHFKEVEMKCRCGNCAPESSDHLFAVLELVRLKFCAPVMITSGHRCVDYNAKIGGAKKSRHIVGDAADIVVKGVNPKDVYNYLDSVFPNSYGLGDAKNFTHIDVRPNYARWEY